MVDIGPELMRNVRLTNADGDVNSCSAEASDAGSTNLVVRIFDANDDASDSGFDDCLGAWTGAARVIARLECAIQRCSLCFCTSETKCSDFCMWSTGFRSCTFEDFSARRDDECTDPRIRSRTQTSVAGDIECPAHVVLVVFHGVFLCRASCVQGRGNDEGMRNEHDA